MAYLLRRNGVPVTLCTITVGMDESLSSTVRYLVFIVLIEFAGVLPRRLGRGQAARQRFVCGREQSGHQRAKTLVVRHRIPRACATRLHFDCVAGHAPVQLQALSFVHEKPIAFGDVNGVQRTFCCHFRHRSTRMLFGSGPQQRRRCAC